MSRNKEQWKISFDNVLMAQLRSFFNSDTNLTKSDLISQYQSTKGVDKSVIWDVVSRQLNISSHKAYKYFTNTWSRVNVDKWPKQLKQELKDKLIIKIDQVFDPNQEIVYQRKLIIKLFTEQYQIKELYPQYHFDSLYFYLYNIITAHCCKKANIGCDTIRQSQQDYDIIDNSPQVIPINDYLQQKLVKIPSNIPFLPAKNQEIQQPQLNTTIINQLEINLIQEVQKSFANVNNFKPFVCLQESGYNSPNINRLNSFGLGFMSLEHHSSFNQQQQNFFETNTQSKIQDSLKNMTQDQLQQSFKLYKQFSSLNPLELSQNFMQSDHFKFFNSELPVHAQQNSKIKNDEIQLVQEAMVSLKSLENVLSQSQQSGDTWFNYSLGQLNNIPSQECVSKNLNQVKTLLQSSTRSEEIMPSIHNKDIDANIYNQDFDDF
ncbi:hypothetical protein SS50377_20126 [Spironucleus salmonicida]|uniref:Uncharacterized protein n=1 Tax=Spironucleus salmonicida TaxID=348837 RepID=V6LLV2_9EUKA|nr:hypothetical protein SS50377_20126 [Spironucleus salmonicida]|eukprot:EST45183.1 Hypothetical protein SS50377_14755 [Spironucleus salmonicida]